MRFYARYLSESQLAQLRKLLLKPVAIGPHALVQFLQSPQGDALLRQLAQVVQTESGRSDVKALRGALVLAASDEVEGLTLLNVLRHYPTRSVQVDLARGFGIFRDLETALERGQRAVAAVAVEAAAEAAANPLPDPLPDLSQPGDFAWGFATVDVAARDRPGLALSRRRRSFPLDLYWPAEVAGEFPVAVISHGLGSDRRTFQYLAEHLASHGFVVLVPEHPGSNQAYLEALLEGRASEVADPLEFLNRPLDVRDALDFLEAEGIDDPGFRGRADVSRTLAIGQSFGGYTALALAGAEVDFAQLREDCDPDRLAPNPSLLLQCRALAVQPVVGQPVLALRDDRVRGAIAANPIASGLFGPSGLAAVDVPVAIVSGSADPIAPPLTEQIRPFVWIDNAPDRYLAVLDGGTHFSTMGVTGDETLQFPDWVIGPDPAVAWGYMRELTVAFGRSHLMGDDRFRPYLSAARARDASREPMPMILVRRLSPDSLP